MNRFSELARRMPTLPSSSTSHVPPLWLLCGLVTAGTVVYLAGNFAAAAAFLAFVPGIFVPACAVLARCSPVASLPSAERAIIAPLLVILVAMPWFYLRRLVEWPPLADLAAATIAWTLVRRLRAFRPWCEDVREAMAGMSLALPFFCLPLLFAFTWAGFAVERGDGTAFYGLYPVDFCNLTSVVSLIPIGDGLPPSAIVGQEEMHYHWPYFAFPALLAAFAGDSMRTSSALVLCNALVSLLLMLAIAQLARLATTEYRHRFTVSATVVAVVFAPLAVYAHQMIARSLHAPWVSTDGRNHNLLSVVNSMTVFGNNTIALLVIVSVVWLVSHWNESPRVDRGMLLCLLLALLPAYSATLAIPVVLALACWFLLGRVRRPIFAAAIALPVAVAGLLLLREIHVLGGSQRMLPGFDGGRFVMTFGLSSAPLWVTGLLGDRRAARLDPWLLLIAAGFAFPTFALTTGAGTFPSDLSMKTATLMVVAMTPMVARGMDVLLRGPIVGTWRPAVAATLLLLGVANTVVYAGQFAATRVLGRGSKVEVIPRGYDFILDTLRTSSERSEVVLDAAGVDMPSTLWPVSRAERRVLLPSDSQLTADPALASSLRDRIDRFREWRAGGYVEGTLSDGFAAQADYLIIPAGIEPGRPWERAMEADGYCLYRSRKDAGESRNNQ